MARPALSRPGCSPKPVVVCHCVSLEQVCSSTRAASRHCRPQSPRKLGVSASRRPPAASVKPFLGHTSRHVSSPRSPNPAGRSPAPGSPVESCGSHTGSRSRPAHRVLRAVAPKPAPLRRTGRCVVRPVDALDGGDRSRSSPSLVHVMTVRDSRSSAGVTRPSATPASPAPCRHRFHLRSLPSAGITRLPRYLRTSPPPCRPGLTLAGCRLACAAPPAGLPVLRPLPSSTRAVAITPAETVGARVARFLTAG